MIKITFLFHLISFVRGFCVTEPRKCSLAGSDVTLYCESNKYDVTPYFIDEKGRRLTSNTNTGFELQEARGEAVFTIRGSAVSHSGTYGCVSGNCRENITLLVHEHIEFLRKDEESVQILRPATQGVISCTVSSKSAANIEWYFKGIRIYKNDERNINGSNLIIKKVKKSHEGNYTCKAVNRKCSYVQKMQIHVTVSTASLECFHCVNFKKIAQIQPTTDNCSTLPSEGVATTVPCISSCVTMVAEGLNEHDELSHLIPRDCSDEVSLATTKSNRTLTNWELEELTKKFFVTPIRIDSGKVFICNDNLCNEQDADYLQVQRSITVKEDSNTQSSSSQLKMLNFVYVSTIITIILIRKLI